MITGDLRDRRTLSGVFRWRHSRNSVERDMTGCFHLLDQLRAYLKDLFTRQRCWLLHKVDRSRFERRQRSFSGLVRDAHDDDPHWPPLHLFADKANAIEFRHDQITRDHVRIKFLDQIQCFNTIARCSDHFKERTAREDLFHHLTYVGRIVDNTYSYHSIHQYSISQSVLSRFV